MAYRTETKVRGGVVMIYGLQVRKRDEVGEAALMTTAPPCSK
jgi:hypothetical protein